MRTKLKTNSMKFEWCSFLFFSIFQHRWGELWWESKIVTSARDGGKWRKFVLINKSVLMPNKTCVRALCIIILIWNLCAQAGCFEDWNCSWERSSSFKIFSVRGDGGCQMLVKFSLKMYAKSKPANNCERRIHCVTRGAGRRELLNFNRLTRLPEIQSFAQWENDLFRGESRYVFSMFAELCSTE